MRHGVDGRKFDRPTAHRLAMFKNLVTDLLRNEKIITTEAKAKEVRGIAERIITLGKQGDLHARRRALATVRDPKVVEKVFTELASRYAARPGGYTRLLKLGRRLGDAAPTAQLELLK